MPGGLGIRSKMCKMAEKKLGVDLDHDGFVHGSKGFSRDKFQTIPAAELIETGQTGDVLLCSGTGRISNAIRVATKSFYSHVSILIRDPPEEIWEKYGRLRPSTEPPAPTGAAAAAAVSASPAAAPQPQGEGEEVPRDRGVYVFESDFEEDGTVDGPVLRPLESVLRNYLQPDYYGPDANLCVRRLRLPEELQSSAPEAMTRTAVKLAGCRFESKGESLKDVKNAVCMLRACKASNKKEDLERVFCSELVAECFQDLGILPESAVSQNFVPKDYASPDLGGLPAGGKKPGIDERLRDAGSGAELARELRIDFDGW